jgi:hypothetical protein
MGSRQIVLVSTAGFSVLNTGIFWQEAKTKRLFSQCDYNLQVSWKKALQGLKVCCILCKGDSEGPFYFGLSHKRPNNHKWS